MTSRKATKKANKWIGIGIILVIAGVQGIGFGQAFIMLDAKGMTQYPALAVLFEIAGLMLGLAIEGGIAYAASAYSSLHGKQLVITEIGGAALLSIAPLILTPIRLFTMDSDLKASMHPWIAGGVVFMLSLAPSIVTLVTAVIDRDGLLTSEVTTAPSTTMDAPSETKAEPEQNVPAFVCSCGFIAKSQHALSGHQLKHKRKKAKIIDYEAPLAETT